MKSSIPRKPLQGLSKIVVLGLSTGLGLGYAPFAPGTFGSLLGIVLGIWLLQFPTWMALLFCLGIFILFSFLAGRAQSHWGETDCQKIVSDEVLGQALTLLSLRHAVDLGSFRIGTLSMQLPPFEYIVVAFVLFRILDIVKPYPARSFDRRPTGFGVIADDVVAGLYGALVLWGIARIRSS